MLRSIARGLLTIADRMERQTAADSPFGNAPQADRATYLALYEKARQAAYPEIDAIEAESGFAIDRGFLDGLALHTQVVVKKSALAWPHGRVLYALLRDYIRRAGGVGQLTVLETGTARGFSALCMARALTDSGTGGTILTFDTLPHDRAIHWNVIDDNDGPRTRRELLAPWHDLIAAHVVFVWGDTRVTLHRVMPERVHFAFLDGQHDYPSVIAEFEHVAARQQSGDMIVFDDVTPDRYPGIVKAVAEIGATRGYKVRPLSARADRQYAIATKA
ncbi:MAG: class I SAM-dependent methyltransferase [Bauldia sp.]